MVQHVPETYECNISLASLVVVCVHMNLAQASYMNLEQLPVKSYV